MTEQETIELFEQGKEAWNSWAESLLAKRASLKENGEWLAEIEGAVETSETAAKWLEEATADFHGHTFREGVSFNEFTFPYRAHFAQCEFQAWADFEGTIFRGLATFFRASFAATTSFDKAEFHGGAEFVQATFSGTTFFVSTVFNKDTFFVAAKIGSFFSIRNATFDMVPDFRQAQFAEAPLLNESDFCADTELAQSWRREYVSRGGAPARWRALKRLAIQAHDHEREQQFFAEEIKSLRYVADWPVPMELPRRSSNVGRYWLGLAYEYCSDFGRSVLRPIGIWIAITVLSSIYYLHHHANLVEPSVTLWEWAVGVGTKPSFMPFSCLNGNDNDVVAAARYVSIHNGLVFSSLGRVSKLEESYACLYGKNNKSEGVIPNHVVYFGMVQATLSAALMFLSLLAVRNYFRIK